MQPPLKAIENLLAGTATPEEIRQVNEWYYSFNDKEVEVLINEEKANDKIKDRIYEKLRQTISSKPTPVKRIAINYKKWLAAAAVFLLFIGGTYMFSHVKKTNTISFKNEQPKKLITPGYNRAVLTLANGNNIFLDSSANGIIGRQGGAAIIKLSNGQVAYNADAAYSSKIGTYNTITIPRGGQYKIVLPDSTVVWLNSATTLKFPTSFTNTNREVTLNGEAYFEVKHQVLADGNKNPFTVNVNNGNDVPMKVIVWGTKFNIIGYDDEGAIKTTLVEGSIEAKTASEKLMVIPGQQVALQHNGTHLKVSPADIKEALAWKNGEFRFKETNIKTIMRQLARWYDVDIVYKGDLSNVTLSGVIPKKQEIQQLLDVFKATGKVDFTISGNTITTVAQ